MSTQPEGELKLYLYLFETGKELSEMYKQYNGDLDWPDFVKETLPRIPGFNDKLTAHTNQRVEEAVRKIKAYLVQVMSEDEYVRFVRQVDKNILATLNNSKKVIAGVDFSESLDQLDNLSIKSNHTGGEK